MPAEPPTINEHLKNLYGGDELDPGPTIRKFRIVQKEGTRSVERTLDHDSLDAIRRHGHVLTPEPKRLRTPAIPQPVSISYRFVSGLLSDTIKVNLHRVGLAA
jgi:hypothetical protein